MTSQRQISKRLAYTVIVMIGTALLSSQGNAATFNLPYSGRLVSATGAPINGPIDVEINFYDAATGGNKLIATPIEIKGVALRQGVFALQIPLASNQLDSLFPDAAVATWLEMTDATNAKVYPRQTFGAVPYALKIPVDHKTIAFDSNGDLAIALTTLPGANQFLTEDSNGNLTWATPSTATSIQGQPISSFTPTSGQVLTFSGGQWVATTLTNGSGTGSTQTLPASSITSGTLNVAQIPSLVGNYVAVAGSSMTGTLKVPANGFSAGGSQLVLTGGNVGIGTTTPLTTLDIAGGAGATPVKVGSTLPLYLLNDFPFVGFNAYYNGGFYYGAGSTNNYAQGIGGDSNGGYLNFYTSNTAGTANTAVTLTNQMTIDPNGNVGIGITYPGYTLDVRNDLGASPTQWQQQFYLANPASTGDVVRMGFGDGGNVAGQIESTQANSQGYIALRVREPAGMIESMRLTPAGVGINTSQPTEALTISSYGGGDVIGLTGNTGPATLSIAANTTGQPLTTTVGARISFIDDGNWAAHIAFATGQGNGTTGTTERMRITTSGNVGIGTTSPSATLNIVPTSSGYYWGQNALDIGSGSTSSNQNTYLSFGISAATNGNGWIQTFDAGNGSAGHLILNALGGNVGIGTTSPSYLLHVNGSIAGVGSYNQLSDGRYKTNVQDLADSLAKILAIRGVTYNWIDTAKYGGQTQIGVIAQEIEKIVPEVVDTGSDGVKRVRYSDLIPLVIEAMKQDHRDRDAELAQLRAEKDAEIAELRAASAQQQATLDQVKKLLCAQAPGADLCR